MTSKTKQNLAVDAFAGEGRSKFDYDGSGNLIYAGIAKSGSSTSAAVWVIFNFVYDGSNFLTDVLTADGDQKADNICENRVSLSYS